MAEQRWTAIVAEDEPLLRQELLDRLAEAWPELEVLAACEDGASAVEALAEHQPGLAFRDIRMPGLPELEVAASAGDTGPRTQIVFVTAYDQHAVAAFEHGAVDYLLKPIAPERLAATVQRLQARSGDAQAVATLLQRLGDAVLPRASEAPPLTWLTASAGKETRLALVDEVANSRADHHQPPGGPAHYEGTLPPPRATAPAGAQRRRAGGGDAAAAARRRGPAARQRGPAADLAHGQCRQGDPARAAGRSRLFPRRQQVHHRGHRRWRGTPAHLHPRPARHARPGALQADPPLHHRQPQGHRRDHPRRQRPRRRPVEITPGDAGGQPAVHGPVPEHVGGTPCTSSLPC